MAYSYTSIRIHLIHSDAAKNTDDTVTIRKNFETNEFDIVYRDENNGDPVTHKVSGLYRARVLDYLYMLFKNQALDEQGYVSIQLTLPALPRLIVSGDKFKDLYYRDHFLEAVGTGLDLLDNTESLNLKVPKVRRFSQPYAAASSEYSYETPIARRSTAPGVRPQHLYFDDDI